MATFTVVKTENSGSQKKVLALYTATNNYQQVSGDTIDPADLGMSRVDDVVIPFAPNGYLLTPRVASNGVGAFKIYSTGGGGDGKARGTITWVDPNIVGYTETIQIGDGTNPPVTFNIVNLGGGGTSATQIDLGGGPTKEIAAQRTAQAIIMAQNAGTLDLTANTRSFVAQDVFGSTQTFSDAIVEIVNNTAGAAGNVAIVTDLVAGEALVDGMSGGGVAGGSGGEVSNGTDLSGLIVSLPVTFYGA